MSNHEDVIDTSEPPVSVPDTGDASESSKLKMIVQLVKKCFGVKDIASMYVPGIIDNLPPTLPSSPSFLSEAHQVCPGTTGTLSSVAPLGDAVVHP